MNWGSWGVNHSSETMSELIKDAFSSGINSFDHADIYGGYTTEEIFGNAFLKTGIKREDVFFISKCGIMYPSDKLPVKVKHYDYSAKHINQSVINSLKYLKTDYLDTLLLHRPSPLMDINELSDTINTLIHSGKIKSFGVSNFNVLQMDMLKDLKISYNQINFSLTQLDYMYDGTLEYMQTNNIIPMAYSPLGNYYKNNNPKIKKVFDLFTKKYNCSDDQLLLAWILKHPSNIYPVIGTTKAQRIKNSKESLKINLETIDWFEMLEASTGKRVA